ncbi:MAG: enoyl-CoA hydratase/isomerase family protein [Dehalococcoidia bacterium]
METIRVERDAELPGLVTVTLNRPDKLNAISFTMHREVLDFCRQMQDDGDTRVIIVTGEGRAFSAGADLGNRPSDSADRPARPPIARASNPLAERAAQTIGNRSSAAIEAVPQVTIAAVNGLAVGGAVVWLSCMDIRLAAASAWFSIPEIALDIPLTWNALPRLVRELGPARTKELVMACDRFTAEDALRWGFLNHVVPDADLMPRARALAKSLLAKDPLSVAATKSTVNALANLMVPAEGTHADPDYLMLAGRLMRERAARDSG